MLLRVRDRVVDWAKDRPAGDRTAAGYETLWFRLADWMFTIKSSFDDVWP